MTKGEGMTPEEYIAKLEEEIRRLQKQVMNLKAKLRRKETQYRCDTKDLKEKIERQAFAMNRMQSTINNRKMYCEEKNENGYSIAIENAELKKQNDNLHEKLGRMQGAFLKFQKKYEEIERELEQIIMIR